MSASRVVLGLIAGAMFVGPVIVSAPARVDVVITPARPDAVPCEGSLRFEPLCDGAPCGGVAEIPARPGKQTVEVPPGAIRWTLRSANCWAPPAAWESHPAVVEVVTWPLAKLSGSVAVQDAAAAVDSLNARLQPAPGIAPTFAAEIACPVANGRWRCDTPAVPLDLRFSADGFVPAYLWDVSQGATPEIVLRRGTSISGWVESADGKPLAGAAVEVSRARQPGQRAAGATFRAVTNGRGFFQVVGAEPGPSYSVTARGDGFSRGSGGEVRVEPEKEFVLAAPIRLEPLASVEIAITPQLDPDGKPWTVQLSRAAPDGYVRVVDEPATFGGVWSKDGIDAGRYAASIVDSRGSTFERREIEIRPGSSDILRFQVSSVAVRGTVETGDEPLAARLAFIRAGRRIEITSDHEGVFRGVLPEAGEWSVEIRPISASSVLTRAVEVVVDDGTAEARVDIRLPGGRIHGRVVDEHGEPVEAMVNVHADKRIAYANTDGEGKFALVGLEPQTVMLEAVTERGDAAVVVHEIAPKGTPVRIVLDRGRRVDVRVVTTRGLPVPGAIVRQIIPPWRRRIETVTGPDGKFTITATKAVPVVDIVIFAAGYPLKIVSLTTASLPSEVVIGGQSARLRVYVRRTPPWPRIKRDDGGFFSLYEMMFKLDPVGMPRGMIPGGFEAELETGTYTICPEARITETCEVRTLVPGAATVVALPWGEPVAAPGGSISGR